MSGQHLQGDGVLAPIPARYTGKSWDAVFGAELRAPLGLAPQAIFYTWPRRPEGTTNPLIAGGLQMTMNEYARVLELEYHRGLYRGERLIADALFTAQATEPYPDAVIGDTPVGRVGLARRVRFHALGR